MNKIKIKAESDSQLKFAKRVIAESKEIEIFEEGDEVIILSCGERGVVTDVDYDLPADEVWLEVGEFNLSYNIHDLKLFKRNRV